jgi:hypothetical protein
MVGSLSGPLMTLVMALIFEATLGDVPAFDAGASLDKMAGALPRGPVLDRAATLLFPVLCASGAWLLGWVNAPDLVVAALSVWLLAGCLRLPPREPGRGAPVEHLVAGIVAPLFYYALLGLPGAVFQRAVRALDPRAAWLDAALSILPARLAALLLWLASKLLGLGPAVQAEQTWRAARLAAWIAAGIAALTLYPRHAFLL